LEVLLLLLLLLLLVLVLVLLLLVLAMLMWAADSPSGQLSWVLGGLPVVVGMKGGNMVGEA